MFKKFDLFINKLKCISKIKTKPFQKPALIKSCQTVYEYV